MFVIQIKDKIGILLNELELANAISVLIYEQGFRQPALLPLYPKKTVSISKLWS